MEHSPAVVKVTFVGAGSIEFTRNVVTDLCGYPELRGRLELALYDISAERLAHAERLAGQIVAQSGAAAQVTATADRRAALAGAHYVINEVQVGGYPATRADFDIPARYGVRQTIGDTLGIGGIFRGLRTIPVVLALARDMHEVCPDAYLLSYSNPMAMLPWAVYSGTRFHRVYGLCHSVRDTQAFLTGLVGADPDRVRFLTAGFNHQAFVLRFEQDGQSLYPRLAEVIEQTPELHRRVRVEIFRRFGYFPTESSEHSAEYVPWFMRHDSQIERFRIFVGDYLERSEENLRELEQLRRDLDSGTPLDLAPSHELASLFIHSVETGQERELHVNIRNGGLISSLPGDCCVEVPAIVGAGGAKPVPVGALPPQLTALNRTFLNVVELTVRAALEESRDHVYQAALLDPNTAATLTTTETVAMVDDLLTAHRDLLPAGLR
ncbi:MAG TPA: alpha-galactosidase [Streptosporangiaceae bacterium]|nr:alpha-galactosidase [Streptosporangiaceae bacterium]